MNRRDAEAQRNPFSIKPGWGTVGGGSCKRGLTFLCVLSVSAVQSVLAAPSTVELVKVLSTIDDRQRNSGDYKSQIYMEQKERDKPDIAYKALVYRRDEDDKLMILFTEPKAEAGKGYLRIDDNLWIYDPKVGKWERRTERERIGGTDSRRTDFDESRLAKEYDPAFEAEEKLGAYTAWKIVLKVKAGVDVAFPEVRLWVDKATDNVLKRQDFSLSGKLMRTGLYPKWIKVFSESKGSDIYYPSQIYFFDEIDKANSTVVAIQTVDLRKLDANLFTKAWLESKSR